MLIIKAAMLTVTEISQVSKMWDLIWCKISAWIALEQQLYYCLSEKYDFWKEQNYAHQILTTIFKILDILLYLVKGKPTLKEININPISYNLLGVWKID